jgi:hypothetical protein
MVFQELISYGGGLISTNNVDDSRRTSKMEGVVGDTDQIGKFNIKGKVILLLN